MSKGKWSWSYEYGTVTNRLPNIEKSYNYTYDTHSNMVYMPHLGTMEWDYKGNLIKSIGGTITTYYRDLNGASILFPLTFSVLMS